MNNSVLLGFAWVATVLVICFLLGAFAWAYERMRLYRALFGKEKSQRKQYWRTIAKKEIRITSLKGRVRFLEAETQAAEKLVNMQAEEMSGMEAEPYRATLVAKLKEIEDLKGQLQNSEALVKLLESANTEQVAETKRLMEEYAFYRSIVRRQNAPAAAIADSEALCNYDNSYAGHMVRSEFTVRAGESS